MSMLESIIHFAQDVDYKYVAIKIEMDGFPDSEVIINPIINMVEKLEYWKNTYNEDLTHKYSDGIKIVDWALGDSFEDIQWDFGISDILDAEYDDDSEGEE